MDVSFIDQWSLIKWSTMTMTDGGLEFCMFPVWITNNQYYHKWSMTAPKWGLEDFNFEYIKYESPMNVDYDGWLQWAMKYFSSACLNSQNDSPMTIKKWLVIADSEFLFNPISGPWNRFWSSYHRFWAHLVLPESA